MRRVRVLRDLSEIKLVGKPLGPLADGEETQLEAWEAAVLERHGIVECFQKLTSTELRKLLLAEERESGLTPIPIDFYSSVAQKIEFARAAGQHEEAEEIQTQVLSLMEIRVPKLVRLAISPESVGSLPPQELFLINRLAVVLDSWSERLRESFEKVGEEVGRNEKNGRSVRHAVGDETDIQKPRVPAAELHARGTTAPG